MTRLPPRRPRSSSYMRPSSLRAVCRRRLIPVPGLAAAGPGRVSLLPVTEAWLASASLLHIWAFSLFLVCLFAFNLFWNNVQLPWQITIITQRVSVRPSLASSAFSHAAIAQGREPRDPRGCDPGKSRRRGCSWASPLSPPHAAWSARALSQGRSRGCSGVSRPGHPGGSLARSRVHRLSPVGVYLKLPHDPAAVTHVCKNSTEASCPPECIPSADGGRWGR